MTITATNLITNHSDSSASSFTTASMTLNSGSLYTFTVGANGSSIPTPTISQSGVTWNNQLVETTGSNLVTTFFAFVSTPVSNTATINFSSSVNNCYWQITQIGNVLMSGGTSGAAAQSNKNTGSATTTGAVSFTGAPSAVNGGYAAIFLDGTASFTSRGGISNELANDVGARRLETSYAGNGLVQTNCATWNWTGNEQYVAMAFEINFHYSAGGFFDLL